MKEKDLTHVPLELLATALDKLLVSVSKESLLGREQLLGRQGREQETQLRQCLSLKRL